MSAPLLTLAVAAALAGLAPAARGAEPPSVYPGCAVPSPVAGHVWRIDPVRGSRDGDGSAARPWRSLQAVTASVDGASPLLATAPYRRRTPAGEWVTAANPDAPIKPGDAIELMSGAYGDVTIGAPGAEIANPDFVTIAAAPGETPTLSSLRIAAAAKFRFRGLKVQGLAESYRPLVAVGGQNESQTARDIVLDGLDVASADDVSGWSQADWVANGRFLGVAVSAFAECAAFVDGAIRNLRYGASLSGTKILFASDALDHLGDDFIDYQASDLIIRGNRLTNSLTIGDGNHQDFMQGQLGWLRPGATSNTFRNIVIDGNVCIRQTDPALRFPGPIQGIDAFDGDHEGVTVSNNVVVTSACHGIFFASLHGGRIVNNTVLDDGSGLGVTAGDGRRMCSLWIAVQARSHQGSPSNDVVVRNNIASSFSVDNAPPGVAMDHNLCLTANQSCVIVFKDGAKTVFRRAPGVHGDGRSVRDNVISARSASDEFAGFDPSRFAFDVRLRRDAAGLGRGRAEAAPPVDILSLIHI